MTFNRASFIRLRRLVLVVAILNLWCRRVTRGWIIVCPLPREWERSIMLMDTIFVHMCVCCLVWSSVYPEGSDDAAYSDAAEGFELDIVSAVSSDSGGAASELSE